MSKNTHMATLIRGQVYTLIVANPENPKEQREITFKRGEAVPVTPEIKARLEQYAVDAVTVSMGGEVQSETRPKFQFTPIKAEAEDAPARPRSAK